MSIDPAVRLLNARLHSAGHLIDVAVSILHYPWKASKGYHFPDSPYVEYVGICEDTGKFKEDIQKEIDKLFADHSEGKVDVENLSVQEAMDKKIVD